MERSALLPSSVSIFRYFTSVSAPISENEEPSCSYFPITSSSAPATSSVFRRLSTYSYLKLPMLSAPLSITLLIESININATVIISAPKNAPKNTTKLLPGLASMLLNANLFLTLPFLPANTCLVLLSPSALPLSISTVSFFKSLDTLCAASSI